MAGKTIKGITIQIDGNATGLGKTLKEIDKESGRLTGNLKQVNAALKLDPTNTDLLSQKHRILGDAIESTKGRLEALNQAQAEASKSVENYDAWAAAYKPIQTQILETKQRIKDLMVQQQELADSGDTASDVYQAMGQEIESLGSDLKTLKKQAKAVSDEFGNPISRDEYDKLQREIVFTNGKLKTLSQELDDTEAEMNDLAKDTTKAAKELDDFADAADDAGSGTSGLGSAVSGGLVKGLGVAGAAVGAVVGGLVAAEEQSKEYRAEMGKLDAAFDSNGHSAETATATYKTLQGVIGETDQSVEAAQQIAMLADSEERAGQWAGYAAGLVGKFGDALQPETFYESANETIKLGEATGAFTQMLEGCGMNVEQFNEDLAACTTEQEKQALMLQVTDEALGAAADSYRQTNAETIRANEANEAWNESLAAVGSSIGPIITDIKLMGAEIVGGLAPAIKKGADAVGTMMDNASEFVSSGIQKIKSLFSGWEFKWPKLKMPHFSVKPRGWEIGDLLKGSIPTLGISWYAKGGILPSAAIFGAYGGKLLGGGEAGQEAILPLDSFYQNLEAILARYRGGYSGLVVQVSIDHFVNSGSQDIDELAHEIADVLQTEIMKKEAAF